MKKVEKIILIGIPIAVVLAIVGYYILKCYAMYSFGKGDDKIEFISSELSENGQYEAILQGRGGAFSFGPTPIRITVKRSDGEIIYEKDEWIQNDGGSVFKENWKVTWYDTYVEVVLMGDEQPDELITIPLN